MKRALADLAAARLARAELVRAAFLEVLDPFGDPRMIVPVMTAVGLVMGPLKEPCSRELECEVVQASLALGARLYSVGGRRLLRGVRRRGQGVAEAVAASIEHRRWARAGLPPPKSW
jgi:hypothetical protein